MDVLSDIKNLSAVSAFTLGPAGPRGNDGAAGAWTMVKKTSDTTRTASTTITADPALSFSMAANTKYYVRVRVFFDTTAAGDFKFRHVGPASPTLVRLRRTHIIPSATAFAGIAVDQAFSAADVAMAGTGTNGGYVEIEGVVHNGANAGTFSFSWAQNTSDAGNTIVRAGSYIEYATF